MLSERVNLTSIADRLQGHWARSRWLPRGGWRALLRGAVRSRGTTPATGGVRGAAATAAALADGKDVSVVESPTAASPGERDDRRSSSFLRLLQMAWKQPVAADIFTGGGWRDGDGGRLPPPTPMTRLDQLV